MNALASFALLYRRCCPWIIFTGCGLMAVALFLQPMSPEDFLALAASAPLNTMSGEYGRSSALLFWISAAATACGMAGLRNRPGL